MILETTCIKQSNVLREHFSWYNIPSKIKQTENAFKDHLLWDTTFII